MEIAEYYYIKKDINMEINGGSRIYFSCSNLLKGRVLLINYSIKFSL